MISNQNKVKILWGLFSLTVIIPIADFILTSFGINIPLVAVLKFIIPLVILLTHSLILFSPSRSALLLVPPFVIGFIFEIIGVNFGVIFGGNYFYNCSLLGPSFCGVPLLIPFFWSFFVYTGYLITSSFLIWLRVDKPSPQNKKIWLLVLLIIIDGLIVVAIDLFMDPIMVASNYWTWTSRGSYFGIPLGNFFGWFLVSIISSGIFRIREFFRPLKTSTLPDSIFLIPVIGYGALGLIFLILALKLELGQLALVGLIIMWPIVLLNLFLYLKYRYENN
ncbi:MAG: carotenoid biosynthesis protein [Candidatus Falkowbacteria bacterium]